MRILTFSTLYPSAADPVHGVFVENRLRNLVASGQVEARVLAPVPWFPFRAAVFGFRPVRNASQASRRGFEGCVKLRCRSSEMPFRCKRYTRRLSPAVNDPNT